MFPVIGEFFKSPFSSKIAVSNSVSEAFNRPPTARNRVGSPLGHACEPPRAIPFISEQLSIFRKFRKFSSFTALLKTSISRLIANFVNFFEKIWSKKMKFPKIKNFGNHLKYTPEFLQIDIFCRFCVLAPKSKKKPYMQNT